MPKTAGGLIAFVVMAVVATGVGLFIINRVGILSKVVYGQKAA